DRSALGSDQKVDVGQLVTVTGERLSRCQRDGHACVPPSRIVTPVNATLAHSRLSGDLLEHQVQLACVLEVSAAKPGNVTPAHDFSDTTYADMVRSALTLGPVFARRRARRRGVGELIADGVRATRRVTGTNTNLGIVLLFA